MRKMIHVFRTNCGYSVMEAVLFGGSGPPMRNLENCFSVGKTIPVMAMDP